MKENFLSDSVETARVVSAQNAHNREYLQNKKWVDSSRKCYGDISVFAPEFSVYDFPNGGYIAIIPPDEKGDFQTNTCFDQLPGINDVTLIDEKTLVCFSSLNEEDVKFMIQSAFMPF